MLIRDTLLYLPAQVLGPVVQLATIIVWTHWLDPAGLGAYALVAALQDLTHMLAVSWWSHYVLRYLAPAGEGQQRLRQDRTEIAVLLGTALLQAGAVWIALALALGDAADRSLVVAAVAATVIRSIVLHGGERARIERRLIAYTLVQVAGPALALVFGLVLFGRIGAGPTAIFAGMAAAYLLVLVVTAPLLGWRSLRPAVDPGTIRAALAYGVPNMGGAAIAWVSLHGIRFVVDRGLGAAAVGLLSVGWGLGQRIAQQAATVVAAAGFPLAVQEWRRSGPEAALRQITLSGALLFAVLAPATVGTMLLARPMVELLVAEPFRAATIAILPLATLAGALRVLRHNVADAAFQLFARPGLMVAVDAGEAILTIAACAAGLALGGVEGAVWGCLLATLAATGAGFALALRRYGLRLPLAHAARACGATAAMALVVARLPVPATPLGVGAAILAGAAIYGAALAAFYRRDLRRVVMQGS